MSVSEYRSVKFSAIRDMLEKKSSLYLSKFTLMDGFFLYEGDGKKITPLIGFEENGSESIRFYNLYNLIPEEEFMWLEYYGAREKRAKE